MQETKLIDDAKREGWREVSGHWKAQYLGEKLSKRLERWDYYISNDSDYIYTFSGSILARKNASMDELDNKIRINQLHIKHG